MITTDVVHSPSSAFSKRCSNIQSLGVYVRYVLENSLASMFYHEKLGLPIIRRTPNAHIFWAGEAVTFETVHVAGKIAHKDDGPAAWLPAYRITSQHFGSSFAPIHEQENGLGSAWRANDPDNLAVILRQRPSVSNLAQDAEAARRAARGETFNPGCKSLEPPLQELGWIIRQVADLPRMCEFYSALGLPEAGMEAASILFDIGDNVLLEVRRAGRARSAPAHRYDVSDAPLLRVTDLQAMTALVLQAGGTIVHSNVDIPWGDLTYFADPEGGVFGMEQNYHPGFSRGTPFHLAENLEGARRWRERLAAERHNRMD